MKSAYVRKVAVRARSRRTRARTRGWRSHERRATLTPPPLTPRTDGGGGPTPPLRCIRETDAHARTHCDDGTTREWYASRVCGAACDVFLCLQARSGGGRKGRRGGLALALRAPADRNGRKDDRPTLRRRSREDERMRAGVHIPSTCVWSSSSSSLLCACRPSAICKPVTVRSVRSATSRRAHPRQPRLHPPPHRTPTTCRNAADATERVGKETTRHSRVCEKLVCDSHDCCLSGVADPPSGDTSSPPP